MVWRAVESASREVLVALYVRDALGIVDPSGLPRLLGTGLVAPAGPPDAGAGPDPALGWAWTRWWSSIVDPGSQMPEPPDEVLDRWKAAMRHHLDSARNYAAIAHDDHGIRSAERMLAGGGDLTLTHLVAEREAETSRTADFDLRIEVLPLAEQGIWWIADSAIAVDEGLRFDELLYARALRPIVERLV